MLDAMFIETVTVRRPSGRDGKNRVTYAELEDEAGAPVPVKCKIDRRQRRTYSADGSEKSADATMIYRVDLSPQIKLEDLIVSQAQTYRVTGANLQSVLFTTAQYGRLDLQFVRTPVAEDAQGAD